MRSHSSIFSFKRKNPLAALWIFLAAVILIESMLAFVPDHSLLTNLRSKVVPKKSPDLLIMGDSVAQGGIIATQLETYLPPGQFVYNMATPSAGPEFPYFQLKRTIDAGTPPKAIILAPSPHTFMSMRVPLLVGAYCTWSEIAQVTSSGLESLETLYGVLCRFSYTLRNREQIFSFLKTGHFIEANEGTVVVKALAAKNPNRVRHWTLDELDARYKQPFSVQEFNHYYLNQFLNLASAHQIPVYWVTLPEMPVVEQCRQQYDFNTGYYRFIDELEKKQQIHFLQRDFLVWSETNFIDQTHLSPDAAEKFTRIIGEGLEKNRLSNSLAGR